MNPTPSAVGLVGFDPVYSKVSDFQIGEAVSVAGIRNEIISLSVPSNTRNRKIYAWLWCANSNATYYVKGRISFFKNQTPTGNLPVEMGGGNLTTSLASVCTSNGSNVQDCLGIYVANPTGTQPASMVLQPLYINGEFDRITFSITETLNVTNARVLLACISSQ